MNLKDTEKDITAAPSLDNLKSLVPSDENLNIDLVNLPAKKPISKQWFQRKP